MTISRMSALRAAIVLVALSGSLPAIAQLTKLVEDKDVGVRFSIPKTWESRSRGRDVFVDCAPGKDDHGRPACYFTVERRRAPLDQQAIGDADRAQWKGWTHADGMRPIISTRDLKVAGLPAYEILARTGTKRDDPRQRRVFILVPGAGQVLDVTFLAMGDGKEYREDQYDRYAPAVAMALETLDPVK